MTMKLRISDHAKTRLRQRFSIDSDRAAQSWVQSKLADGSLIRTEPNGKLYYRCGNAELIVANGVLITVQFSDGEQKFLEKFGSVLSKEVQKLLTVNERALRKAEINVAEINLNMLKARNPKIKAMLGEKLTKAIDEKDKIVTEIKLIRKAASQYGVEA